MELKWANESEYTRAVRKEKKVAKQYGGVAQPCSGRLKRAPGDVKTGDFLIEHKHTKGGQYTLKLLTLQKIAIEANDLEKQPALMIDFETYDEKWVIVKESVFKNLM